MGDPARVSNCRPPGPHDRAGSTHQFLSAHRSVLCPLACYANGRGPLMQIMLTDKLRKANVSPTGPLAIPPKVSIAGSGLWLKPFLMLWRLLGDPRGTATWTLEGVPIGVLGGFMVDVL